MALSIKRAGAYIGRIVIELPQGTDLDRFQEAWDAVAASIAVLRTRIIQTAAYGFLQLTVDEPIQWARGDRLDGYLEKDAHAAIGLGARLTRYAIIADRAGNKQHFVWTAHHAIYDGWSVQLILDKVDQVYQGAGIGRVVGFNNFVKYLGESDASMSEAFWRSQLADTDGSMFPALPTPMYQPRAEASMKHEAVLTRRPQSNITTSTIIRAAWSILVARLTGSSDTVFGATVTGRNAPVPGVEEMMGPTISTVPIRVRVDRGLLLTEFLDKVQAQAVDMIPFEHTGLQNIRQIGADAQAACAFQTLLVIQPEGEDKAGAKATDSLFGVRDFAKDQSYFNTYAVMLVCSLGQDGRWSVEASFDRSVIDAAQAERLLAQFAWVVQQLCLQEDTRLVGEVECMSEKEKGEIWEWNEAVPDAVDALVHQLIEQQVHLQPRSPAVCSWDGELTYGELNQLSSTLAAHLVGLGVGPEVMVPLCFEKSLWTVVSMLAVTKAGGAFALLDASHPSRRLEAMVHELGAEIMLTSTTHMKLSLGLSKHVVVVNQTEVERLESGAGQVGQVGQVEQVAQQMSSAAALYVVFTSGSTGLPKGVVVGHSNYCSGMVRRVKAMRFEPTSRVLDFASYSFDMAIDNMFTTLSTGGCVCIPSDSERKEDIVGAMNRLNVDIADLTPSVARLIAPDTVPGLRVLILIGEAMTATDVSTWAPRLQLINAYGPAECSLITSANTSVSASTHPGNIGRGLGAVMWVTDARDHNRLLPVGAVGELLVEGPILARGYLNDEGKTAAAFIEDPAWLLAGGGGRPGRRGRLYKTGDLVRYNPDGTLSFVGRKDTQVKLRGQRIELGEVEHRLRQSLPARTEVAAEVITPAGRGGQPALVAFVAVGLGEMAEDGVEGEGWNAAMRSRLERIVSGLDEKLADCLPAYMVPSAYIPVGQMPMTVSAKTDRKRLREIGSSLSVEQLAAWEAAGDEKRAPATAMERRLQMLWATTLSLDSEKIGGGDSFFRMGGDSISAMKLVGAARLEGVSLTVTDVFRNPRLSEMAVAATSMGGSERKVAELAPFSLFHAVLVLAFALIKILLYCRHTNLLWLSSSFLINAC